MLEKRESLFLVLGKNPNYKKVKIDKIRDSLQQKDPQIIPVHLFAEELSVAALSKEIDNMFLTKRVFIFKSAENLSDQVKTYLLRSLKTQPLKDFFIFDFDIEVGAWPKLKTDKFFSFLLKNNLLHKIGGKEKEVSLRDLAFALRGRSIQEPLRVMSMLFRRHPKEKISMQILGLMIKIFSDTRSPYLRKEYMRYLFRADRLIKEGVLNPQRVLELLILRINYASQKGIRN